MEQEIVAKEIKPRIHRQRSGHTASQGMQGGEGLVNQNLINHDLKKDRGDQGDGIDEQHRQGDIDKGQLLAEDLGNEPAEAEGLGLVGQLIHPFEHVQLTAPDGFELFAGEAEVAATGPGQRVIAGDLCCIFFGVGLHPGQDHMVTIFEPGNGRIGLFQLKQSLPIQAQQFRLQPKLLGHAQQGIGRDFVLAETIFMNQAILGQFYFVFPCNN